MHNHASHDSHGFNITSLFGMSSKPIAIGGAGFWGPVTSTLDWCEENHIVSQYVAEWWNATTNLVFLIWPLIGIYSCYKTGSERRFALSYAALILVGTGSFLFHGTLTYAMQLLDELPMCMATCVFVYCHLQMFAKKGANSPKAILALAGIFLTVTTSYLALQTPILFQVAFVVLTLMQLFGALNNIRLVRRTHKAESNILYGLIAVCVTTILTAFALWNTDQIHCGSIQEHRNQIGYPLRVGLELHAWWHLLTGYSGYVSIVGAQYCRLLALGRNDIQLTVRGGFLPVLMPRSKLDNSMDQIKMPRNLTEKSKRA
ncbi:alkaline ceramidase 3 [Powellomyces hirtus]|nr:alkaline ceramidase 3 [Powellomyces hirtus]